MLNQLQTIKTLISNGESQTLEFKTSFFKEAGIIERYGSGIQRIKDECKSYGVKEPIFEEFVHGFRVVIFKEKIDEGVNGGVNEVYNFIKQNEALNAMLMSDKLTTPLRTIQR